MTELKRLAKNCEYGELTNSIFKDRIVEGINNRSNCTRCGRRNHSYNKCPAVGKECRKCHKLNHFMIQCKIGDNKLPRYPRKPRVNEIEKNGKQETDGDPSSDEHEFSIDSTETTADKSDPWIVPLEVNNNVVVFN